MIGAIRSEDAPCPDHVQAHRDEVLRRFHGAENPYLEYCAFLKETYRAARSPEEIHTLRYQIAQEFLEHEVDYKPDADTFLRWLKAHGFTLVIASTTKRSNMEVYRTRNAKIRGKARIDDYFTLVYAREDAKEIKPNPEIYLRVMADLGVSAEQCLVFEDSLIGIEAAKNAGMETVAVYDRHSDGERTQINALADARIQSYTELMKLLRN